MHVHSANSLRHTHAKGIVQLSQPFPGSTTDSNLLPRFLLELLEPLTFPLPPSQKGLNQPISRAVCRSRPPGNLAEEG